MAKGADKNTQSRRGRRRGGLRVPSDEVPRPGVSDAPVVEAAAASAVGTDYLESEAESEPASSRKETVAESAADLHEAAIESALSSEESINQTIDLDGEEFDEMQAQARDAEVATNGKNGHAQPSPDDSDAATVEYSADDAEEEVAEATPSDASERPDSVDIAFDDEEEDEAEAAEESAEDEDEGEGEGEEEAVAEADADEADVEEGQAAGEGARAKPKRPETMSLSDQDLEELADDDAGQASAAVPPPHGVPAAVASLEEKLEEQAEDDEEASSEDGGSVEDEADPGDSGEILPEDLLEEIDEKASAGSAEGEPPPTPAAAAKPPPSPVPKPPPTKPAAKLAAPPQEAERKPVKPWFDEIFDEDYLRTLPFLTPQATQAESQFVMESLEVGSGAQILDVACGYGRHAMELAARGYQVVGLDSSLSLLLRGAEEAQRRGLTINFVHGDMRELNFDSQFDGAYCLFNSFGFFDDETNKKTAQNISRALKPGARLVIDVLNRDYLIGDLPTRVWWEGDGCVVLEEVEFNYFSSRIISNRSVVFDDGRQVEQEISIRSFSLHELGKLLHATGFRVIEVSGSIATRGRFFGAQSRDLVVVAERRK